MPGRITGPIKVLWLIKGLGPGGSERLLAAAASAHDSRRVNVSCFYALPGKDHLVSDLERAGVDCTCLAPKGSKLWILRLRSLIRDGQFEIVHIHSPLPGVAARLLIRTLKRSSRPRIVTTEHNAQRTYHWAVRRLNGWTGHRDAAVIAVSNEARTSLGKRALQKSTLVLHGIDIRETARQRTHRTDARAEFGFVESDIVFGTVANFRPQKDFPNLLNALVVLRDQGLRFKMVIVGQGPLEAEMIELTRALGLGDVVTFTGFRADATRAMSAFDVFVLSSRWEGLPVALMEAFALGLPIVSTSVGGIPQVLTNQQDALLVPGKDSVALAGALARMHQDPVLRRRMSIASKGLARDFDIHRATSEIEAVYARVLGLDELATVAENVQTAHQPAPTRRSGLEIRQATPSDRDAMIEMMSGPLDWGDDPRNAVMYEWKHDHSPFGASPTWLALDGERVVGVRAFMRWEFRRGDEVLQAVRAVDTATDPDYQGRGLFTELTNVGVQALTAEGCDFVFNTPNSKSRPGYLKMGWKQVGSLSAAVRLRPTYALQTANARRPADRWSRVLDVGTDVGEWLDNGGFGGLDIRVPNNVRAVYTPIDEQFLRWRFAHPLLPYRVVEGEGATIIVRARCRGQAEELVAAAIFGDPAVADKLIVTTLRDTTCAHALRLGKPNPKSGFIPMFGGPMLTWRALAMAGMPPLANWKLSLGDIELL